MLGDYIGNGRAKDRLQDSAAGPYLDDFSEWLAGRGYRASTIRSYLEAAAWFTAWALATAGTCPPPLHRVNWAEYRAAVDHATGRRSLSRRDPGNRYCGARTFVRFLRARGDAPAKPNATPVLLQRFQHWMQQDRGAAAATVAGYTRVLRSLLAAVGEDTHAYTASKLRAFVLQEAQGWSHSKAETAVSAVRMFVRFLLAHQACSAGLEHAIPRVAGWGQAGLPRYLSPEAVAQVLAACDPSTPLGARDHAVLLLLARLGLRAGDVAGLRLPDLDWAEGRFRVTGKTRREAWLPLPQDVGEAILHYLHTARPCRRTRWGLPDHLRSLHVHPQPASLVDRGAGNSPRGHRLALARRTRVPPLRGHPVGSRRPVIPDHRVVAAARGRRYDRALRQGRHHPAPTDRPIVAGGGAAMLMSAIDRYLALRRALGYSLGSAEPLLRSFARYAALRGDVYVLRDRAQDWAAQTSTPRQRAKRLGVLLPLARFLHAEDPRHELLPRPLAYERGAAPTVPFRSDGAPTVGPSRRPTTAPPIAAPAHVSHALRPARRHRVTYLGGAEFAALGPQPRRACHPRHQVPQTPARATAPHDCRRGDAIRGAPTAAPHRHRQNGLGLLEMLRGDLSNGAKEGADRRQTEISSCDAVASDVRCCRFSKTSRELIEILEREVADVAGSGLGHVEQQELQGVAVGMNRVPAGIPLAGKVVDQEMAEVPSQALIAAHDQPAFRR